MIDDIKIDYTKIPERGMMYATYISHMDYRPYTMEELKTENPVKNDLLELHLFDEEKEYRIVRTHRKGLVDYGIISDDTMKYDDIYEETVYVSGSDADLAEGFNEQVTIVSYIYYDEDDILHINNYRLKEVKA